jgi:hypothetical protein
MEGGFCNTRHMTKTVTDSMTVCEAGVDTARALFGLNREFVGHHRDQVDGLFMQFYPAHALVAVEGHPLEGELAPDEALAEFVERGCRTWNLGAFLGFSRIDATATIAFDDPAHGAAVLQAAAAIRLPYLKPGTYGNPLETVNLHDLRGRGRILARLYDKGRESGSAAPGKLIRVEEQARLKSGKRLGLQACARSIYAKRFAPMAQLENTVAVCSAPAALEHLAGLYVSGGLSEIKFEKLSGFVHREARNLPGHPRTRYRRVRELRDLGVALTDQPLDGPPVDLAAVIGATIESEAWR